MLRTWLADAWQWIGEPTGRLAEVTAATLVILTTIGAVIGAVSSRVRPLSLTLISISAVALKRLAIKSAIHCAKLRLGVLVATPETLVDIAREQYNGDLSNLAEALALVGRFEEAKSIDLSGAIWGIALKNGPQAALQHLAPLKDTGIGPHTTFESMNRLRDRYGDAAAFREWQIRMSLTVPFGRILDLLIKESPEIRMPPRLDDASRYIKSEPVEISFWVTARDNKILAPIDKRRLRVLLHAASCKSLSDVAVNFAMLAYSLKHLPNGSRPKSLDVSVPPETAPSATTSLPSTRKTKRKKKRPTSTTHKS